MGINTATLKFDGDAAAKTIAEGFGISSKKFEELNNLLQKAKEKFDKDPTVETSFDLIRMAFDVLREEKKQISSAELAFYMYGLGFTICAMKENVS